MIEISRPTLWSATLAAAGVLAITFPFIGLSLDLSRSGYMLVTFALVAFIALGRRHLNGMWMTRFADTVEITTLFSLVSLIGALASYAVATFTVGYRDDYLAWADNALGFDWVAYYRFVAAHPWFAGWAKFFYLTIFFSPVLIIAGLTMTGHAARARTFVMAILWTLAITLIGFYFFPARSAVAYHIGMTPTYVPATGLHHVNVIDHLRDGSLTRINPASLSGLITFPSFHMIGALLFIWAAWPIRGLRVCCTAINAMMIVIIPVEGSHYLVDLLGGALVTALVLTGLHLPILKKIYNSDWRASWQLAAA